MPKTARKINDRARYFTVRVPCPTCKSDPWHDCTTASGANTDPHMARRDALTALLAVERAQYARTIQRARAN